MCIVNQLLPDQTFWPMPSQARNPYAVVAGRRIAARRKELQMTQEELSKATNNKMTPTRIANYEQGSRELHILPAKILAQALKTNPSYLMGLIDEIDSKFFELPVEAKMYFISALEAATKKPGNQK